MLLLSWLVSFCFAVLLCLSSVTAARWARGMDGKEVSSFVAVAYSIFSATSARFHLSSPVAG